MLYMVLVASATLHRTAGPAAGILFLRSGAVPVGVWWACSRLCMYLSSIR